ncbi:hypothetical protein ACFLQN_03035 [Candidatus Aenigmatarchaeota archaeon]
MKLGVPVLLAYGNDIQNGVVEALMWICPHFGMWSEVDSDNVYGICGVENTPCCELRGMQTVKTTGIEGTGVPFKEKITLMRCDGTYDRILPTKDRSYPIYRR